MKYRLYPYVPRTNVPFFDPSPKFYTAKNAHIATSLLTSCNNLLQEADIRMCSHGLRQLVITSLLQVVNRRLAS